ncbi:hypothetical protein D3C75_719780 [compost metagenome]
MLIQCAFAAVIKGQALLQKSGFPSLCENIPYRKRGPQVVIGMDAGHRVPSLIGEEIMVHMPILILLPQQQTDLFLRRLRIKRGHRQYILRRIPESHPTEGTGGVEGNIARKKEVPLGLIRIPDVDHPLRIFIRQFAVPCAQITVPVLLKRRIGTGDEIRLPRMCYGLPHFRFIHRRPQKKVHGPGFTGLQGHLYLKRTAGVTAQER